MNAKHLPSCFTSLSERLEHFASTTEKFRLGRNQIIPCRNYDITFVNVALVCAFIPSSARGVTAGNELLIEVARDPGMNIADTPAHRQRAGIHAPCRRDAIRSERNLRDSKVTYLRNISFTVVPHYIILTFLLIIQKNIY